MRPEVDESVESMVLRPPARPQPRSHPGLVQLQRARPHLPVRHTLAVREVGLHDAQPLRPVHVVVKKCEKKFSELEKAYVQLFVLNFFFG